MDWEQLRYFDSVAKFEHVSKAAEALDISQSTLSRAIDRIEERFGVPLFDRVRRGIRLNAYGKALQPRVQRAILELENAEREIQELARVIEDQIGVGLLSSLAVRIVPSFIRSFQRTHPKARFRLLQGQYDLLRDHLRSGELDVCITPALGADSGLTWQPLWREELVMLLPSGHALSKRKHIRFAEIAREPLAVLRVGNDLRSDFERLAKEANVTPQIAYECVALAPLVGLVGAGVGVALVPRSFAESQSVAKYVRLDSEDPTRVLGVTWNSERFSPKIVRDFRQMLEHMRPAGLLPL
jgi:DNA-binding transcriptional LysR family regulator